MKEFMSLIVLFTMSISLSASEVTYSYVSFPKGNGFVDSFHITDSNKLIQGDIVSEIYDCSSKDFYCTKNKLFTFALPSGVISKPQSWLVADLVFNYSNDSLIIFRGVSYPVMVVSSSDGNNFFYSSKYGLLALNRKGSDNGVIYLLSSSFGLFRK